jgi:hypothetical protein
MIGVVGAADSVRSQWIDGVGTERHTLTSILSLTRERRSGLFSPKGEG